MTNEEDAANERQNEIIRACEHEPARINGKLQCIKCGAFFAVLMLPRLAPVPVYDFDDDE